MSSTGTGAGRVKRGQNPELFFDFFSSVLYSPTRASAGSPTRDLQYGSEVAFCCIRRPCLATWEFRPFDLSGFAVELEAAVGGASGFVVEAGGDYDEATAYGADPPGMYPSYRNAEANAMAEEESEGEIERLRAPRSHASF